MNILVIGPSCSGKTTLLTLLRDLGQTVHLEPENEVFPQFLKEPKKYAFESQSNLMSKLIAEEVRTDTTDEQTHFYESGVLATEVYNRFLHDKEMLTDDEFRTLDQMYTSHMRTHKAPDLVVFLSATPEQLKDRAVSRDGRVAMDPNDLFLYWEALLKELQQSGIGVLRLNTGFYAPKDAARMLLLEVDTLRAKLSTP